jgi:hypothetical protein
MPLKFNPFSGNFDFTGSGGGGGGSSFFTGEVATYADLPLGGTAPLNSRWLVRTNTGTWPLSSYKQAGIYVRTGTVGSSRDDDYTLTDTSFHDVMSDDAFLIFDNTDPTKAAKFDVGANVSAGQTRVVSFPDKNITLDDAGDSRTPLSHAASHAAAGSDPVFDQDLNTDSNPQFNSVTVADLYTGQFEANAGGGNYVVYSGNGFQFFGPDAATNAATTRTNLGLGNSATLDTGTTAGTVATGDHTHTQLHDRSHAITSTSDHTAGNHKVFYSNGSGEVVELALGDSGKVLQSNGATSAPTWETPAALPVEYVIACSDETSDLTTGTAKVTFRAPVAFLLTGVAASVNTAPTGSTIIVDINNGANSALSTKLSIDASEKTSATAATAAVIDTTYDDFAADAEITIDIDQIGSTIAGKGLKVILKGTRA